MTPKQKRIKIAVACGWTIYGSLHQMIGRPPGYSFNDGPCLSIPNYLISLDAMHEAEKVLTLNQRFPYIQILCRTLQISSVDWAYIHATAAQRADAFLETLGLLEN